MAGIGDDRANRGDGLVGLAATGVAVQVHLDLSGLAVIALGAGRRERVTPEVLDMLNVGGVGPQPLDQFVAEAVCFVAKWLRAPSTMVTRLSVSYSPKTCPTRLAAMVEGASGRPARRCGSGPPPAAAPGRWWRRPAPARRSRSECTVCGSDSEYAACPQCAMSTVSRLTRSPHPDLSRQKTWRRRPRKTVHLTTPSMVMRQLRLDPSVWAWMLVSTAGTVVEACPHGKVVSTRWGVALTSRVGDGRRRSRGTEHPSSTRLGLNGTIWSASRRGAGAGMRAETALRAVDGERGQRDDCDGEEHDPVSPCQPADHSPNSTSRYPRCLLWGFESGWPGWPIDEGGDRIAWPDRSAQAGHFRPKSRYMLTALTCAVMLGDVTAVNMRNIDDHRTANTASSRQISTQADTARSRARRRSGRLAGDQCRDDHRQRRPPDAELGAQEHPPAACSGSSTPTTSPSPHWSWPAERSATSLAARGTLIAGLMLLALSSVAAALCTTTDSLIIARLVMEWLRR